MLVLLAVRFFAELGMLAALAWGGWHLADSTPLSALLAVALPLAAAAIWGRWVAPKARHRLRDPARLGVEVMLFAAAVLVLVSGEWNLPAGIWGTALLAAFVVSIPARGHELNRPPV